MNLLDKLCKELGVEIGERWLGNDGFEHIICEDGRIVWLEPGWGWKRLGNYEDIFTGKLKPIWKPRAGEEFYIIDLINEDLYDVTFWSDNEINYKWLERGLVFNKKEDAIAAANKMLNILKIN